MENKNFLDVNDVAAYMGISSALAYKIIRQLNSELAAQGYITVAGKVSRRYFNQKVLGTQAS